MYLEEKILGEYSRFYFDMMHHSRADIYQKSSEIELRKRIRDELTVFVKALDEKQIARLSVQENLTDSVYRFLSDLPGKTDEADMQNVLKMWLDSIEKI